MKKISKNLSLETLDFPPFLEVKEKIVKKVGKRPAFSKSFPKGFWSEQSLKVLGERYLMKNAEGKIIETPEELCWRVSWEIASAEAVWGKNKKEVTQIAMDFYNLLVSKKFLPNSPTLMNAGTNNNLQYSACFVLPVEDSLVGIFDAIKYQALIHQTGGGTGFSFSRLRPQGSIVRSSHGTASGPVSFMRVFDAATNEIKQGGRRRGANMGILRVDHPDILEFIHCKSQGGITNFNISVGITDKFMEAYKNDTNYDLLDPKKNKIVGSLSAKKVFEEIAKNAWENGDPGLLFIDRLNTNASNPIPALGPIEATNPCGEQPLYPYDACNLGSIFLNYFVGEDKNINWNDLRETVNLGIRFLDNVIEVNPYPLEQIRKTVLAIRRVGLGIGGWADTLLKLGTPYDSQEALDLAEKVMSFIQHEAVLASQVLAQKRGFFPLWPISIYKKQKPRRNATVTTIAPTGSISIIAGASSGIEPLFALAFRHIVKDKSLNRTLTFINPLFEETVREKGVWSETLKEKVSNSGFIRNLEEIPEEIRALFGTAHEISFDWHIKTQAAFQKYTENAVSKTINLPHTASLKEVKKAYLLAWELNCKGITVFRDGSKETQVLNLGLKKKKEIEISDEGKDTVLSRPFKVVGATYRLNTPVGTAFVTINEDEKGEPLELFINVGKAGSDVTAMAEALGRTISISLRFQGRLSPKDKAKEIALQLAGIGGRRSVGFGANKVLSLPDAIAMALSNHFGFRVNGFLPREVLPPTSLPTNDDSKNGNGVIKTKESSFDDLVSFNFEKKDEDEKKEKLIFLSEEATETKRAGDLCPSCGAGALVYEEGCSKCYICGHSEC